MLQKQNSRRTSQRLKSGPFSLNQPTKKSAQVHLNRISSQFKKRLKHGSTMDIVDSVKTEIGWLPLCILFLCLISICYIITVVISSGNNSKIENLHNMHNRAHPDHMRNEHDINSHLNADGNAIDHGLHIDPEHWPHHLRQSQHENVIRDIDINTNDSVNIDGLDDKSLDIKSSFMHVLHGYDNNDIQYTSDWTLIHALDTMMLMGIKEEYNMVRDKLATNVHFDIDLEIIRCLGGLIGAYEMSKVLQSKKDDLLLKQAVSLSDDLLEVFDTEIGSNQLEFYAMSGYTEDGKYYEKLRNLFKLLPKNEKKHGFYEYTLKLWILTNYNDKLAIKLYMESIAGLNEKLLSMIDGKKMEELQCFMPGVLALGSYHAMLREEDSNKNGIKLSKHEKELISERDKHLKLAHSLLESCYSLYSESNDNSWSYYSETVESLFILYSLTHNEQYRIWGWNIFKSIKKHSDIEDVNVISQTFKYLYLLFNDYAANLLPLNKFVFNTEAHPIPIIHHITNTKWYKPQQFTS